MNTNELDEKIGTGVRNITLSKLPVSGLVYDIDGAGDVGASNSAGDQDRWWLRWETRIVDPANGTERWIQESAEFESLEEGRAAESYIRTRLAQGE